MLHKDIPLGDIHYIHNWEVADATARNSLVVVAADKGKLCWQKDTNEFHFLANNIGPVWIGALGVGGPIGPSGLSVLNGVVAPTSGIGTEGEFYIDTATSTIYGPKGVTTWPAGIDLVGPQGPQGIQGPIGVTGDTGPIGPTGAAGIDGTNGTNGLGVPAGGATGTVLTKVSGADNDTEWAEASGAGTIVASTAPSTPSNGQGWYDLNTGIKYIWVDDGYSSAWVEAGPVAPKPAGREILTANRTYYVATTGNDSNDGLAVGTPFLTIQKAVDIVCGTLDLNIYQATIQVADGAYTDAVVLAPWLGKLAPIVNGNTGTPANVSLSGAGTKFTNYFGGKWILKGFKLASSNSGAVAVSGGGSLLELWNIDFGQCNASQISATYGGSITFGTNYAVSGGSTSGAHMYCIGNASISTTGRTVTLSNTPNFPGGWAWADRGAGYFEAFAMTFTGTGATGPRYILGLLSSCFVNGGGANYFPGNAAGTVATGAQYA